MGLQDLKAKAKRLVRSRKGEIDKGLNRAEQVVSAKTGGKYDKQLKSARRKAEEAMSDKRPESTDDGPDPSPR